MNSIQVLLEELQAENIQLWVEEDRLRYRCPNNALTPELREQLSAHKSEIIAFLRQQERVETIPIAEDDFLPLSFAQQRLWFLDQLEPNLAVYNTPLALRLQGNLDISALEKSLEKIVERHSVLRTNFPTIDGKPYQNIVSELRLSVPVVDMQHLDSATAEAELQDILVQFINEPFDLAEGKVIRSQIFHISASEYILVTVVHHIAFDAWSSRIWWQELMNFYQAFAFNEPISLPELSIQYKDFAVWQKSRLQGDFLDQEVNYWREKLADAPQNLDLLTDNPRPPVQTHTGDRQHFHLSSSQVVALKQLGLGKGATLYMTLLTAFAILLHRYSGQEDFLIGSPIANRNYTEIENLIGFFVNTLALRINLAKDITFLELLQQVRDTTLEAYSHQDIPFEKLVEELQPQRDRSRHPLFQVMFALQNVQRATVNLPDINVSSFPVSTNTSKFDITVILEETKEGLKGFFEYSNDLFNRDTIIRAVEHFQTLLEGIVAHPDQLISQLPLFTNSEQKQILVEWNQTKTEYPQDKCIHQLFEEQVEKTPDAIAVVFEDEQLTYQQLNEKANQLAHYLKGLGVGTDVLVGLYVERSVDIMVGILGILKAGGAYVPLDPKYPSERLALMIQEAQVEVILTQQHLINSLLKTEAKIICLDTDWQVISSSHSPQSSPSPQSPNDLAYVIYTSGSTGKPKGVAMPHRPLVNLITWQLQTSTIEPQSRTLQYTPISFDVSFQEIFSTLTTGGTLVLITDETRRNPSSLLQLLQQQHINRLFLPFVALQQLAEVVQLEGILLSSLQEVITAGEQLRITEAIAHLFTHLPHCTLHNHYGPSETHVVTAYTLTGSAQDWAMLPPIGHPIANTQIYLLDAYGQPVPIGVAGELYIGGAGMARGYLHRPELTAKKFVSHPLSHESTAKLYRTGDLARYLPDGNVEFLGRLDDQVKIRGFRIELGEVEAVLNQHPHVFNTVAIAREDIPGDKRLIAYIILEPQATPSQSELREFLRQKLPDYMIPSVFVFLDKFPLTPNGKINRRALPKPELTLQEREETFIAPRNELEEKLAVIWQEILKIEPIGIHDNFFELGGHSLLTVSLVTKIETTLGKKLPITALFELTTIAQLANYLKNEDILDNPPAHPTIYDYQLSGEQEKQLLAIIVGRQGERPHPHSFMVKIHSKGDQEKPFFYCANSYKEALPLANCLEYSFYLLESGYTVFGSDYAYGIKALAARHVEDILRVQPHGFYSIGGYSYGTLVAYEISQQLQARGKTVDLLVIFDRPGTHFLYVLYQYFYKLPSHISWILSTLQQSHPRKRLQDLQQKGLRILRRLGLNQIPQQATTEIQLSEQSLSSPMLNTSPYQFAPYEGRVVLLCAEERKTPLWLFPHNGWSQKILPNLEVYKVPGTHHNMIKSPHVEVLAKQLKTCLQRIAF